MYSQNITSWVIIGFWYDITTYAAFFLTTIYWFSFNTAIFPDNGKYPIANGISWTPQHYRSQLFGLTLLQPSYTQGAQPPL